MKILLIFLLTFFVACNSDKAQTPSEIGPQQQATKVIISQNQSAQNDWTLSADKAEFYDAQNQVRLYNPVLVYSKEGSQDSTIKAKEGWYDISKNLIIMSENVQISSLAQAIKINTKEIFYDTDKKESWSITPIKMKRGKTSLTAQGFRANQDFSQIELFKQKTTLPQNMQDFKPAPLTLQEALSEN